MAFEDRSLVPFGGQLGFGARKPYHHVLVQVAQGGFLGRIIAVHLARIGPVYGFTGLRPWLIHAAQLSGVYAPMPGHIPRTTYDPFFKGFCKCCPAHSKTPRRLSQG